MNSYIDSSKDSSRTYVRRYCLIVITMMCGFIGGAEYLTRAYVIPIPNRAASVVHKMYEANSADVLIGDSHTYRDFMREGKFLNLGRGGTTIAEMSRIAEVYFRDVQPGRVIIEASPQLLGRSRLGGESASETQMMTIWKKSPIRLYVFDPAIGGGLKTIKSPKALADLKAERKAGEEERKAEGNWGKMPTGEREEKTRRRVDWQRPDWDDMNENATEEQVDQYRAMIAGLKTRGAEICMIRTPVDNLYRELTDADASHARANEEFRSIAEELEVRYVDARDLNMEYTLDKFLNQDHLTPKASEEFSRLAKRACFPE